MPLGNLANSHPGAAFLRYSAASGRALRYLWDSTLTRKQQNAIDEALSTVGLPHCVCDLSSSWSHPRARHRRETGITMRELSPAAKLKLEELANQPRATFKQRLALLQFQAVVLLILYVVVRIMLKIPWLGRGLSKVVKLSREGPLYKFGVWMCRRLARVTMGRHAYAKPICAPAVRIKKRTATSIEVKVVAVRGRFGNADDVIVESRSDDGAWTPLTYDASTKTATAATTPGSSIDIRARASNVRGAGPWSAPLQATALLKPNAFYGGDCGEFSWRQTPETVTCVIELPKDRKDVVVEATRDTLTAGLGDVAFFDKARLLRPVAETRWEIVDGALHITLEKAVPTFRRSDHWDRLFATGPRVDTALLPLSLPSIASG